MASESDRFRDDNQSAASSETEESSVRGSDEAGAATRWGIGRVPWLWATRIRILFVIDGRITEGRSDQEFGLGLVLDTLRDRSFAWWVRFEVEVRSRNPTESFRFTENGFDLDDFDQVWFFGDWPGEIANDPNVGDDIIEQDSNYPLSDAELCVVAEWMERGGGVFATGDHALLGASMCYRIPRVRTMRKWTRAQGVPNFDEDDRNETLVHVGEPKHDTPFEEGALEGDRWPQRIFPVLRQDTDWPFVYGGFPHPLLCGKAGVIDHFPDHMHEGEVFEDEDVQLDQPLEIPGFQGVEYPTVPLDVKAAAAVGGTGPVGVRPRPHLIARGLTSHPEVAPRTFGLIGVYDGDPVQIGRVVVDSTWHHWFSMNLVDSYLDPPWPLGERVVTQPFYRGMQNYYRNVALWLSTPAQRASMLFAAVWGVLVGKQPGAFGAAMGPWGIGERVVDAIGRTAPQCIVAELVATLLRTGSSPKEMARRQSAWARGLRPPTSLVNELVVGNIALALLDLAHHHINERARGKSTALDEDAIRNQGLAGIAEGKRQLGVALADGSSRLAELHEELTEQLERTEIGHIPIERDSVPD
jgi:hypothetical protein